MQGELTAIDNATTIEVEWIRKLLMDICVIEKPTTAIMKSSRHVKRILKSVEKMRNSKVIALDYIQMSRNSADPFIKGLSCNVIENASSDMGLTPTL
jgi:hypothetical protein